MWLETRGQKAFKIFNYVFMFLLALVTMYPFYYVLIASFNSGRDFARGGVYLWPRVFTLENYEDVFHDYRIAKSLMISLGRTVLGIVLGVLLSALAGYALSVKDLPGRTAFNYFWLFTMLFSGGMIPFFMVLRTLHLTKSFWLYVIPSLYNFLNMVLIRTCFQSIPKELRESAQLDGAGDAVILFKIYLPLSVPVLATLALFIGVAQWNDWFMGAYYCSDPNMLPAATLLQKLLKETSVSAVQVGQEMSQLVNMPTKTPQSLQMAFVMVLTMPIVIFYPLLQKYYVKGVMLGSVKG